MVYIGTRYMSGRSQCGKPISSDISLAVCSSSGEETSRPTKKIHAEHCLPVKTSSQSCPTRRPLTGETHRVYQQPLDNPSDWLKNPEVTPTGNSRSSSATRLES